MAGAMPWLSFLDDTLRVAASAAAGGAATALTANPILGLAAGAAAKKSTEELLGEFLPAQKQALDMLLERTQNIELLLGRLQSDLQALIEGPWRTALLHIEDAQKHPAKASEKLELARQLLYEAWGQASRSASRALIAQELSAVYALQGEPQDSIDWLLRSYPDARDGAGEAVLTLAASLPELTRVKANVESRVRVPPGVLGIWDSPEEKKPRWCVPMEPFASALAGVAQARVDLAALRRMCADAGLLEPWTGPTAWELTGGLSRSNLQHLVPWASVVLRPADGKPSEHMIYGSEETPLPAATLLDTLWQWHFSVRDVPVPSHGEGAGRRLSPQVFVSGSSPELGRWRPEAAIPLNDFMTTYFRVLDPDRQPVEYKYFYVPEEGGPAVWEPRPNRISIADTIRHQRSHHDRWASA